VSLMRKSCAKSPLIACGAVSKEGHLYTRLQNAVPSDMAWLSSELELWCLDSMLSNILYRDFREHPFHALRWIKARRRAGAVLRPDPLAVALVLGEEVFEVALLLLGLALPLV